MKGVMPMKTVIFCFMLLLAFPVSGKTAVMENHKAGESQEIVVGEIRLQLSENGNNEEDPATDDGEDLRDGDSDSDSNDDSDKDDG